MGYEYVVKYIPVNPKRRPGRKIAPQYLTIHSTGNEKSTARGERAWLENPSNTRTASWHICVDEKEAIEAIPLDEMAYHAGTTAGNTQSISIEICESGDRQKTLDNAIKLTASILRQRGWGIDRLRRHYDWSGKVCPRILSQNNWAGWKDFVDNVRGEMIIQEVTTMFKDVAENRASRKSIERVAQLGIFVGYDGKFYPDTGVTREELAVVIDRLLNVISTLIKEGKL